MRKDQVKAKARKKSKPPKPGQKQKFNSLEGVPNRNTLSEKVRAELRSQGNEYLAVSKIGRDKIFSDPNAMLDALSEYVVWMRKNPWVKYEYKGKGLVAVPIGRPYTMGSLTLFFGVNPAYFENFERQLKKDDIHYEGFNKIIALIRETVRNQKFEGAAVNAFNARLISYDLGIAREGIGSNGSGTGLNIIVAAAEDENLLEEVKAMLEQIDKDELTTMK